MIAQTAPTMKARYATFHGTAGYAIRTPDMQVLFVDASAQGTILRNEDAPFLVLLGDMNIAVAQHMADAHLGGAAAIACTRMEGVA